MRSICAVIVLVSAFLLVGCETLPKEQVTGIQSISVFTGIGDTLKVVDLGTTVFQQEFENHDIENWNIDKLITLEAENVLSDSYTIIATPDDDRIRRKLRDMTITPSIAAEQISKLQTEQRPDAYLIIAADKLPSATTQAAPFAGYGAHQEKAFGMGHTFVYAAARLYLIDGRDFTEMRQVILVSPAPVFGNDGGKPMHYQFVKDDYLKDDLAPLDDEKLSIIKGILEKHLKTGIPISLQRLKIIQ